MWLKLLCSELDATLKQVEGDHFAIINRDLENFTNN